MGGIGTTVFTSLAKCFHGRHNTHEYMVMCYDTGGVLYACMSHRPLLTKLPADEEELLFNAECQCAAVLHSPWIPAPAELCPWSQLGTSILQTPLCPSP